MGTNETSLVTNIEVNKSKKSDHKKIEISTRYSITNEKINKNIIKQKNINDVNFHDKNKWDIIKDITNSNIETSIVENSEIIEQLIDFIDIIHRVSLDELPKKKKNWS